MKRKIFTFSLMLLITASPFLITGQNQVSKSGFFKSLSLDPVITLHNKSAEAIECITVSYKIDGGQMQNFNFGGTLPANTSVELPLPRMQVSNGLHFFDASVSTLNGETLKNKTFAEGLAFTLSPGVDASGKKIKSGIIKNGNTEEKTEVKETGCDCQNGDGLDEDISFWFNVYINDRNKLTVAGSNDHGKRWYLGQWSETAGLEKEWNTAEFTDPKNKNRSYRLNVSTEEISENITYYAFADNEIKGYELNDFNCKAYPNPFSDLVNIEYTISQKGNVDIMISDLSGKLISQPVKSLSHGKGQYTYNYNTSKLSQGVYYCTIRYGSKKETLKLVKK